MEAKAFASPARGRRRHPTADGETSAVRIRGQPTDVYDLLPPPIKSPSFLLRFDLVQARARLVLVHRTVRHRFDQLDAADRRSLLAAAAAFAHKFELRDASLRVPLVRAPGRPDPDGQPDPFHAFLVPPHVGEFLRVFRCLSGDVPLWPCKAWRTRLWPEMGSDETLGACFERAVRANQMRLTDPEVMLCKRRWKAVAPRQRSVSESDAKARPPITFVMQLHSEMALLGFARPKARPGEAPESPSEEQLALMDAMHSVASHHAKGQDCHMCLALAGTYASGKGWGRSVIGFLEFGRKVPRSVRHEVEKQEKALRETHLKHRALAAWKAARAGADPIRTASSEVEHDPRSADHETRLKQKALAAWKMKKTGADPLRRVASAESMHDPGSTDHETRLKQKGLAAWKTKTTGADPLRRIASAESVHDPNSANGGSVDHETRRKLNTLAAWKTTKKTDANPLRRIASADSVHAPASANNTVSPPSATTQAAGPKSKGLRRILRSWSSTEAKGKELGIKAQRSDRIWSGRSCEERDMRMKRDVVETLQDKAPTAGPHDSKSPAEHSPTPTKDSLNSPLLSPNPAQPVKWGSLIAAARGGHK